MTPRDTDRLGLGRGPAGKEMRRAKGRERSHQTGRSLAGWHLTKGRPTGQSHGRQVWRVEGQSHLSTSLGAGQG